MVVRRSIGVKKRLAIYSRQNGLCAICGIIMRKGGYEIDHIQALIHDGDNENDNLRAVHPACHRAKTDNDIAARSKADRIAAGGKQRRGPGFRGWRKFSGEIVWRDAERKS